MHIKQIKEYFNKNIGIDISYENYNTSNIPNYLLMDFDFYYLIIEKKEYLLALLKDDGLSITNIEKRLLSIRNISNLNVILGTQNIESYERRRLIEKRISFIVPPKQMYIPNQMIDLREHFGSANKEQKDKLTPSAQLIVFYHILKKGINGMIYSELAKKINYSKMTISRSINVLDQKGLVEINKKGVEKEIQINLSKSELWQKVSKIISNPIISSYYIEELSSIERPQFLASHMDALSYYTDIRSDKTLHLAIFKDSISKEKMKKLKSKYETEIQIELWNYNPRLLTEDEYIDPLSLYAIFQDSKDERINMEIDNLINRRMHGNRSKIS